ncbi:MAG TPA: hypothetical protein PKC66_13390, partial [Leptospiraceae bacterium]|nr:hypothetical protein [Leptospiraceae bacterium]
MGEINLHITEPIDCHLWKIRFPSVEDWPLDLKTLVVFEEDVHFERSLKQCDCGQLYFYEMIEFIDFERGEDPIYRTLIPIADEQTAVSLNSKSKFELINFLSLRYDWPNNEKNARVY